MSVYVDASVWLYGRIVMCHMFADTHEELVAMADRIGVARKWIKHPGQPDEHFDICNSKRTRAVVAGALELDRDEFVALLRRKRVVPEALFDERPRTVPAAWRAIARDPRIETHALWVLIGMVVDEERISRAVRVRMEEQYTRLRDYPASFGPESAADERVLFALLLAEEAEDPVTRWRCRTLYGGAERRTASRRGVRLTVWRDISRAVALAGSLSDYPRRPMPKYFDSSDLTVAQRWCEIQADRIAFTRKERMAS